MTTPVGFVQWARSQGLVVKLALLAAGVVAACLGVVALAYTLTR